MNAARVLGSLNKLTVTGPSDSNLVFVLKKGAQAVKNVITKLWDPEIEWKTDGVDLEFHLSHKGPNMRTAWPLYDQALLRLCDNYYKHFNYLQIIDVGANVGDTTIPIVGRANCSYLCIEPSNKYFPLLVKNSSNVKNIHLENVALGDAVESISGEIDSSEGSGSVQLSKNKILKVTTLDELVYNKYPSFLKVNILKIDADGYDYKVIRGAKEILSNCKPALFFELAPEELAKVAKEDPLSIFSFLHQLGYEYFLVYDYAGFLISPIYPDQTSALFGLIDYASNKWGTWLDVLAFHKESRQMFEGFYSEERASIKELAGKIPRLRRF